MITIITVGKRHDPLLADAIAEYQKRLRPPFDVAWTFLPHAATDGPEARRDESRTMMALLKPADFVILLDEHGTMLDSPALSARLEQLTAHPRPVTFVIGGAYGVDDTLTARADFVWSLSPLVFPHRIVRLLLIEQVYRAQAIKSGQQYHHE